MRQHTRTAILLLSSAVLMLATALPLQAKKPSAKKPPVGVTALRVENLPAPQYIDTDVPRFSWQITSDQQAVQQEAYHIVVKDGDTEVWNSGKVPASQQLWVEYKGKPLRSSQTLSWQVKVYTSKGESEWTDGGSFHVALLSEAKWSGYWIGLEQMMPGEQRGMHTRMAARYLRKEFQLKDKAVRRATAYVAGIGLHEFYVNGRRMGDGVLQPVPSDYRKTIYYNTYDITSTLTSHLSPLTSHLCLGIALGNGRLFPMQQHKPYKIHTFGYPKCRINVIVEYEDGSTQRLQTDDKGWKITASGPIRANNEYDGEEYDARREMKGWSEVGYDDSSWLKAERTDIPQAFLRAQMTPGMKVLKKLQPIALRQNVVDLGQNIAGWLKVRMRGQKGDTIRIVYAEKLNADGTLYRENFRNAYSTDVYVCNGLEGDGRWWAPTFVYHGFRYAEVIGLKNATKADFEAELVADDMQTAGTFECSDTILNKVVRNAWWGIIDNYKGMPVDCPQRDERQPWLGDRTMGSLGESYLFNNERLYTKWMRDICEAQRTDGCIPDVAPSFWNYYSDNVTWPAALPFTCDMLWRQYGNRKPVDDCYPHIKKWVQHIISEYGRGGIIQKDRYGDWCPPPEKLTMINAKDPDRITDGSLMSTAYIIRTLQLMEQWGCEPELWKPIREQMTEAFNKRFLTVRRGTSPRPGHVLYPDSVFYGNNTVTANILPLALGIVPDDCKSDVVRQIVDNICIKNKGHVSCGVIGISWLLRTLSDNGFADVAYLLATQKSYPSWGYMAEQGATTIWELWNGDKASPKMNSGNHVMLLGDLLTWCYQYLGGIKQQPAGQAFWRDCGRLTLKPSFEIQDCDWVKCSYDTPYGRVVSNWKKSLQHVDWHVEIPSNTTAEVCLPNGKVELVSSGSYDFSVDIPTASPSILKDEFLYNHTIFPEAHASTIVETRKGDLVAAYFGGTHERDPDVCIWVNIKKSGSNEWSAPILAADGVLDLNDSNAKLMGLSGLNDDTTPATAGPIRLDLLPKHVRRTISAPNGSTYDYLTKTTCLAGIPASLKRKACWNPVLMEMPNGELWLFFKIGTTVGDWTGWLTRSKDGGRTWSNKEPLPFDSEGRAFLGPIKNKPEIVGNRLLCGSSTEGNGWRFHMEVMDMGDGLWKSGKPVKDLKWTYVAVPSTEAVKTDDNQPHPIDCIQPSILKLKDGRLQVLMRTHNARLATSYSSDGGMSWTPVTLSDVENNQSGTDAVTMQDGRHVLIYNNFATLPLTKKGPRTPLSIALSNDGQTWQHWLTLEDSPIDQYSYPAIIQGRDGTLHCIYTWRRQRICYKQVRP